MARRGGDLVYPIQMLATQALNDSSVHEALADACERFLRNYRVRHPKSAQPEAHL